MLRCLSLVLLASGFVECKASDCAVGEESGCVAGDAHTDTDDTSLLQSFVQATVPSDRGMAAAEQGEHGSGDTNDELEAVDSARQGAAIMLQDLGISRRKRSNITQASIIYGTTRFVIVSGSTTGYSSNCGWYGCRVGQLYGNYMKFDHGGSNPTTFGVRIGSGMDEGCMKYGHEISLHTDDMSSSNRRRRGQYLLAGKMVNQKFYFVRATTWYDRLVHATVKGKFYVRPPAGQSRSGCVKIGDCITLGYANYPGYTSNCGWYGCRVAGGPDGNQRMTFGHGGSNPKTWCLQASPGPSYGRRRWIDKQMDA